MNTQELHALIAVVESGSFTKAASRLGRVQSSISQRIKSLEESLGVVLVERGSSSIVPTDRGLVVYEFALKIVELMRDCKNSVRDPEGEDCVRIGIIECLPSFVADRIIDISDKVGINVGVSLGNTLDLIGNLNAGLIDMAIVGSGFSSANHIRNLLFSDTLLLTTACGVSDVTTASALNGETFLVSSKRASSIRNIDILFEEGGIKPRRVVECGSYDMLLSKIAQGKGVSLALRCSISAKYSEAVKTHAITGRFSKFQVELLHLKAQTHAFASALEREIRVVFKDKRLKGAFS